MPLEEFVHDLRQPLSIIEALAYHLELNAASDEAAGQLRKIQEMVAQANRIIDRVSADQNVAVAMRAYQP